MMQLEEYQKLIVYKSGIAVVRDTKLGCDFGPHPSIHKTGSVRGMKDLHYWDEGDRIIRGGMFQYNVSNWIATCFEDVYAARFCKCGHKKCGGRDAI